MEPTVEVAAALPEAQASCSATLRREAARLSWTSPQSDAAGTLFLAPPGFAAVKAAVTQAQATSLARPNPTGLEAEVSLKGLDVVPLVSDQAALRQLAVQQSGQPVRLRLNGRVRVAGTVRQAGGAAAAFAEAGSVGGSAALASRSPWEFTGELGLESVRVNQLKLWQKLAGRLAVSDSGLSVHGKGLRPYETLDLDLALPLLAPQPAQLTTKARAAAVGAAEAPPAAADAGLAPAEAPAAGQADPLDAAPVPEPAAVEQVQPGPRRAGGGRLQLRYGPLQVAADINAPGSQLNFKVGWGRARATHLSLCTARREVGSARPTILHAPGSCVLRVAPPCHARCGVLLHRPPKSGHSGLEAAACSCSGTTEPHRLGSVGQASCTDNVPLQVAALKLDELELASLRGDLQVCEPALSLRRVVVPKGRDGALPFSGTAAPGQKMGRAKELPRHGPRRLHPLCAPHPNTQTQAPNPKAPSLPKHTLNPCRRPAAA